MSLLQILSHSLEQWSVVWWLSFMELAHHPLHLLARWSTCYVNMIWHLYYKCQYSTYDLSCYNMLGMIIHWGSLWYRHTPYTHIKTQMPRHTFPVTITPSCSQSCAGDVTQSLCKYLLSALTVFILDVILHYISYICWDVGKGGIKQQMWVYRTGHIPTLAERSKINHGWSTYIQVSCSIFYRSIEAVHVKLLCEALNFSFIITAICWFTVCAHIFYSYAVVSTHLY